MCIYIYVFISIYIYIYIRVGILEEKMETTSLGLKVLLPFRLAVTHAGKTASKGK